MTGATGNFYCGLHESEDMAFVLHLLRPDDVFYDIGANVGVYSLLAAATGASEIHGFEPSPETHRRYMRNVAINGLGSRIHAHCVALGETDGEVRFTRGSDTTNHVVAEGELNADHDVVQKKRLDDFFVAGKASFMKLDVEGFEIAVLDGAAKALQDPQLIGLLVEDDGYTKRYGEMRRAPAELAQYGFHPYLYDPFTRTLMPRNQRSRNTNKLFLRDPAFAASRVLSAPEFRLVNGWI